MYFIPAQFCLLHCFIIVFDMISGHKPTEDDDELIDFSDMQDTLDDDTSW